MNEKTQRSLAGGSEEGSSKGPMLVVILAAFAFIGAVGVIIYGYLSKSGWVGVTDKTFWDYLELLIVPAALAIGVTLLNQAQERERNAQEDAREQQRERDATQREQERESAEEARRNREQEIDVQRAQDAELRAYLAQIGQLLLDKERPLGESKVGDAVRTLARARTLSVVPSLDGRRKRSVVQFLYESDLITVDRRVVDLTGADFTRADLGKVSLSKADLSGAILSEANMSEAVLEHVDLSLANLSSADLSEAKLAGANLRGAELLFVYTYTASVGGTQLSYADLEGADLSEAVFDSVYWKESKAMNLDRRSGAVYIPGPGVSTNASLIGANLKRANLHDAKLTDEQLAECKSLEGATMPDGQILKSAPNLDGPTFEEWLKDREQRGKAGENEISPGPDGVP
jgi:uncharacterized protein YjbI with pentapeptide repeats